MPDNSLPRRIESALHETRDESSFIQKLLIGALDWRIPPEAESVEDITYEWDTTDLHNRRLSDKLVEGKIHQIPPMAGNPWGVFLLDFEHEEVFTRDRGMTGPLRQVLRGLVPHQRNKAAHLPSFDRENLLFICNHDYKHYRFAHFKAPHESNKSAPLAAFGWGPEDRIRTLCEYNLPSLQWPETDVAPDQWIARWSSAFDVEKVTKRFYEDYDRVFTDVERMIGDRNQLEGSDLRMFTLSLFNRLMFLRFVERKGWLSFGGRTDYLTALRKAGGMEGQSLYQSRLRPLFFEGLTTEGYGPTEAYGEVPFLNGGLFEPTDLDNHVTDVPDEAFDLILRGQSSSSFRVPEHESPSDEEPGLFYRYNFTVAESTPLDIEVAVDPEMLGKVFEELVTGRHESGSYYTPRPVVAFMCREALKGHLGDRYINLIDSNDNDGIGIEEAKGLLRKLADITVCDPACGSGAYLLGMMQELDRLTALLSTSARQTTPHDVYQTKLDIIRRNIYGVDNDPFATNIAQLRLWLTLAVEHDGDAPEPLPNLNHKIERGDSLEGHCSTHAPTVQQNVLYELAEKLEAKISDQFNEHTDHKYDLDKEINSDRETLRRELDRAGQAGLDWFIAFPGVFTRDRHNPGFDVVIANPPYGVTCGDPLRTRYFPQYRRGNSTEKLPKQSKDSYGLFMARGLEMLKRGGQFTYIVSDTWRTIKSHWRIRDHLLRETSVQHVLDLPDWIFGATVNTCILTLTKGEPADDHRLIAGDLRGIERGGWERLAENLTAVAGRGPDAQTAAYARYTYPQSLIATYDNLSFFIASPKLYRLMSDERFVKLDDIADVKVGLQTGDNKYYLRAEPTAHGNYDPIDHDKVLTEEEVARLTDDEKLNGVDPADYSGRCFVPYDKGGASNAQGGWLPNYHVPTEYYIDWSVASLRRLKTMRSDKQSGKIAARFQNSEFYFVRGVTWSDAGIYSPTFRESGSGVFDVKGSRLVLRHNCAVSVDATLGLLASVCVKYLIINMSNHSVSTQVGDIRRIPIYPGAELDEIAFYVSNLIVRQQADPLYPYHLHEQNQIDALVYELYGLNEQDIREVELWYCRRYPALARAQGVWGEVHEKYAAHLARCEKILSRPPSYWASHPILELIAQGEGQTLEFKQTLHADNQTGAKHKGVLHSALKTIAAFLNTNDGTLLIGITDAGEITGLDGDYALCRKPDADGLELKLRDLLKDRLSPPPFDQVSIAVETLAEGQVCRVDVQSNDAATITELDDGEVFIRDSNRTLELKGEKLDDWKAKRLSETPSQA